MTPMNDFARRLAAPLHGAAMLVLQLLLAAAGFVFVLFAAVFGVVLGSVLMLWALLRGRRPNLRYGVPPSAAWQRFEAAARQRGFTRYSRDTGEVIDAEVKEVPTAERDPRAR